MRDRPAVFLHRPLGPTVRICRVPAAIADGVAADMGKQIVAAGWNLDSGPLFDEVPEPARRIGAFSLRARLQIPHHWARSRQYASQSAASCLNRPNPQISTIGYVFCHPPSAAAVGIVAPRSDAVSV
jgi:hypothetical protein